MTVRAATPDDVDHLFEIRCSVVENHQSREELAALGITPASVTEMIESADYVTTLAEVDGVPAGFAMVQISKATVFALFVSPQFERRGIGGTLLGEAEQALATRGVKEAWLSTGNDESLRAIGFYHRHGWRDAGVPDDGQRCLKKDLKPV